MFSVLFLVLVVFHVCSIFFFFFFFSSRRRHTRYWRDWSSDVCSSDLTGTPARRGLESKATARGGRSSQLPSNPAGRPRVRAESPPAPAPPPRRCEDRKSVV